MRSLACLFVLVWLSVGCVAPAAQSTPPATPTPDTPRLTPEQAKALVADRCAGDTCEASVFNNSTARYLEDGRWEVKVNDTIIWDVDGTLVTPRTLATKRLEDMR